MAEGRVIRLSWDEWLAGRAAKRAAFEARGRAMDAYVAELREKVKIEYR